MGKRATAIKIFGILLLLVSIWSFVASASLCREYILKYRASRIEAKSQDIGELLADLLSEEGIAKIITTPAIQDVIYACIFLVFAILNIYSSYGLLRPSPKRRLLFLIVSVVFPLFILYTRFISLFLMFLIDRWAMKPFLSLALLDIFGLILLMLPKAKERFK